jgi:hypothetical protein
LSTILLRVKTKVFKMAPGPPPSSTVHISSHTGLPSPSQHAQHVSSSGTACVFSHGEWLDRPFSLVFAQWPLNHIDQTNTTISSSPKVSNILLLFYCLHNTYYLASTHCYGLTSLEFSCCESRGLFLSLYYIPICKTIFDK